ncbi:hypothetical protein Nmel_011313 [Mimus melanotis]
MYIKCPFLCKMLRCLKQCGLKVIFRKFFIHRHLPSVTDASGNALGFSASPPSVVIRNPKSLQNS